MRTLINYAVTILSLPFLVLWALMEVLACISLLLVGVFYKEEAKAYVNAKAESLEKLIESIK